MEESLAGQVVRHWVQERAPVLRLVVLLAHQLEPQPEHQLEPQPELRPPKRFPAQSERRGPRSCREERSLAPPTGSPVQVARCAKVLR